MEYLIPILLVIIAIAVFVTFIVLNATKKGGSNAEGEGSPPGIGQDETPLGDTSEHAGEQTEAGTTVGGQDADRSGGTGGPVAGYDGTSPTGRDPASPDEAAHVARPGEGEGHEALGFEGREPAREPRR